MLQVRILPGLPLAAEGNREKVERQILMLGGLTNFIKETRQELNKVTWPSRDEVWQATLVVIFTTMLMALFIGMIDFVLSLVMRILLG